MYVCIYIYIDICIYIFIGVCFCEHCTCPCMFFDSFTHTKMHINTHNTHIHMKIFDLAIANT